MPENEGEARSAVDAIHNFPDLHARQIGFNTYQVLHLGEDSNRVYTVDLSELTCTCPDWQFNRDAPTVCKHMATALFEAPKQIGAEQIAVLDLGRKVQEVTAAVNRVERLATGLQADAHAAEASVPAGEGAPSNASPAARQEGAEKAAERLEAAYADVVPDMQVKAHEGYVWVQTGKDTPETLPGPGNVSVFDALLKNPEQVEFIHDDHDDVGMKPGKWWRNRIDPTDVDAYISEVLE